MGSYDGAESCELVGTYLLHNIKERFGNACNFGLYRDDGQGVTKASPRQAELIKKELWSIFAKYGLKITIEANKKVVNFLDVTLNLANGKYLPYNKPGNIPLYVNKKSNHPPHIIENIPKSINKRLSEISIDEDSFSKAAPLYQKALDDSGYNHKLALSVPTAQSPNSGRRNRHRDIIWYNPPFSRNVATNVGRSFLKIVDEEFPKGHALHKIFNRNTVKISHSCMPNLKQNIDDHSKSTLRKTNAVPPKACNCRQPAHCPLDSNCLKSAVIYQATVATEDDRPAETYVGVTENYFKTRYSIHKSSFRDPNKRLSKHIWHLKDAKIEFSLT